MKTKFYQIVFLCLALVGITSVTSAQTITGSYDPFTTGKAGLTPGTVVPGSYLRYQVNGDQGFGTSNSTFVWYVEGGELGTYNTGTGVWTPIVAGDLTDVGLGKTTDLTGANVDVSGTTTKNSSEIWVKWDDVMTQGYIAVYELSPDGCIANNTITGFNVTNLDVVNVLFAQATSESCSNDDISMEIEISIDPDGGNEDKYYPLTLAYTEDGTAKTLTIAKGDVAVDAPFIYNLDKVPGFIVADANIDEDHTFIITGITDKNGAIGTVTDAQKQHVVTVNHLPQTGTMVQN